MMMILRSSRCLVIWNKKIHSANFVGTRCCKHQQESKSTLRKFHSQPCTSPTHAHYTLTHTLTQHTQHTLCNLLQLVLPHYIHMSPAPGSSPCRGQVSSCLSHSIHISMAHNTYFLRSLPRSQLPYCVCVSPVYLITLTYRQPCVTASLAKSINTESSRSVISCEYVKPGYSKYDRRLDLPTKHLTSITRECTHPLDPPTSIPL